GWILSGQHLRYSNGLLKETAQPIATNLTVPVDTTSTLVTTATAQYDGLGRMVSSTDFKNNTTTTTYHPKTLSVVVQDPEQISGSHQHSSTTLTFDGHGRAVQRVAHLNSVASGSADVTTTTQYLATGEVSAVTQGSYTRWMQYDSLGRLVFNAEPNTSTNFSPNPGTAGVGGWTYVYNDAGDLVATSDARGCGKNIFHDTLGRVIAEDYSPCAPTQPGYTSPYLSTGDGTETFVQYDPYGLVQTISDRAQT